MIKIHPSNVGKRVVVNGKRDTICYVTASGEYFRLEGERNSTMVYDYPFEEIMSCEEMVIQLKEPYWVRVSFNTVRV